MPTMAMSRVGDRDVNCDTSSIFGWVYGSQAEGSPKDLPSRSRSFAKASLFLSSWSLLVNESLSHYGLWANKRDREPSLIRGLTIAMLRITTRLLASLPTSNVRYSMEPSPLRRSIPIYLHHTSSKVRYSMEPSSTLKKYLNLLISTQGDSNVA